MKIRPTFATPWSAQAQFTIELNPARRTERDIAAALQQGMLYEQVTSWVMIGLLRPGDLAIDIGAHVGYYTLLMRTLVGSNGKVFAAEPMPDSFKALRENIARNGFSNVRTIQKAVSDVNGSAKFQIDSRNEGESHLATGTALVGLGGSINVTTTTLDTWLDKLNRRPRLIKLDAEGCESRILDGARTLFSKHPPESVICEINPPALARFGTDQFALRRRFEELGYECFLINIAPGTEVDLCGGALLKPMGASDQVTIPVVHNLLFCTPDSRPVGLGID